MTTNANTIHRRTPLLTVGRKLTVKKVNGDYWHVHYLRIDHGVFITFSIRRRNTQYSSNLPIEPYRSAGYIANMMVEQFEDPEPIEWLLKAIESETIEKKILKPE